MKAICAWCGKFLSGDMRSTEVSHGICENCAAKLERDEQRRRDNERKLKEQK